MLSLGTTKLDDYLVFHTPLNEEFMGTSWDNDNSQPISMSTFGCSTAIDAYKTIGNIFSLGIYSGIGLEKQNKDAN